MGFIFFLIIIVETILFIDTNNKFKSFKKIMIPKLNALVKENKLLKEQLANSNNETESTFNAEENGSNSLSQNTASISSPISLEQINESTIEAVKKYKLKEKNEHTSPKFSFWQTKTALALGVIFVILASFIFATTSWQILPNYFKVLTLLFFTFLIFALSHITEKYFKLPRTGKSLYLVASFFIFASILSASYFNLFGSKLNIQRSSNIFIFFLASFFTEISLLLGLKRIKNKAYALVTMLCFNICFLLLDFSLSKNVYFRFGLFAFYSICLLYAKKLKAAFFEKEKVAKLYDMLNKSNFILAILLLIYFSTYAYSPLEFMVNIFIEKPSIISVLYLGFLFIYTLLQEKKNNLLYFLSTLIFTIFVYRLLFLTNLSIIWNLLIVELAFFILFAGINNTLFAFKEKISYIFCLAISIFNSLALCILFIYNRLILDDIMANNYLAVLLSLSFFIYLILIHSKKYSIARGTIPFIGLFMCYTFIDFLHMKSIINFDYKLLILFYIWLMMFFDYHIPQKFAYSMSFLCAFYSLYYWLTYMDDMVFFTNLTISLFPLTNIIFSLFKRKGFRKDKYFIDISIVINMLLIISIFTFYSLDIVNYLLLMITMTWFIYLIAKYFDKYLDKKLLISLNIFTLIFNALAILYLDIHTMDMPSIASLQLPWLVLNIILLYRYSHRDIINILRPIDVFSAIVLLFISPYVYEYIDINIFHICLLVVFILLIAIARFRYKIIDFENKKYDWINILSVLAIFYSLFVFYIDGDFSPSLIFFYICSLAIYFLQYIHIENLRPLALLFSSISLIVAYYMQPWFEYPTLLDTELRLLPLAIFTYFLNRIFIDNEIIENIRKYSLILFGFILGLGVLFDSSMENILIFEIIHLSIFFYNNYFKKRIQSIISGIYVLLIAIYWTRAFWIRIYWWVYLLVAGLALIIYAAYNEKKKNK